MRSSRIGYKNRQRIAPFYIKNEHGVRDVAQRLHWDDAVGAGDRQPAGLRLRGDTAGWFYHHVSDWMGDDAFIEKMSDSIRKFNYLGDTQFLSGRGRRQA